MFMLSSIAYLPGRVHFKCEDIQSYFQTLANSKQLPSFEELEIIARQLYDTYSSTVAQYEARTDARDGKTSWADQIPLGAPWMEIPANESSVPAPGKTAGKRKSTKQSKSTITPLPFYGDQVVSDSAYFMRDASIAREAAAAVAVCDVGRLYETLKVYFLHKSFASVTNPFRSC